MADWHRTKRRVRVRLARQGRAAEAAFARPDARAAVALALALLLNAGLLAMFGQLPVRLPPEGGGGAPIEIVFLPVPPAPDPEPEPELTPEVAEAGSDTPEPAPQPRRGPAAPDAELPSARGASGVIALDCKAVFDEEGRAVACAGGDITLGYEVDEEAWDAIRAQVPRYGPGAPVRRETFGAADRYASERPGRSGRRGAPTQTGFVGAGAESAASTGADLLAPQSFVTSWEERTRLANEAERREDARFRRERIRDLEREQ